MHTLSTEKAVSTTCCDVAEPIHWLSIDQMLLALPITYVQARWSKLEDLYHEGLVQSIGLRDCTVYQLQQLIAHSRLVPSIVSVEVHPFYKNAELVSFCKKKVGDSLPT